MAHASLTIDQLWVLLCAALVFMMQAGFMCLEAGLTRSKNSINVAIKNLCDFGVTGALFWAVGFGLMFGVSLGSAIGSDRFFFSPSTSAESVFFVFQVMFCGTAVTIISGALAERLKFSSYLMIAAVTGGFIYPIVGHWIWSGAEQQQVTGWLGALGFVDFAGGTVVHSLGGWVALAAVLIIGPRAGRFADDGTPRRFNGSNIPLAVLGVMILWFGWFGFNGGSIGRFNDQIPGVLINTLLGGVFGMVASVVLGLLWQKRVEVVVAMNGALGGLVAVTPNCNAITVGEAGVIGAIGGVVVLVAERLLERVKIDDVVGAIPVHLFAGVWGTLAVALFGDPAILGTGLGRGQQFLVQLAGVGAVGMFAFGTAFVVLKTVNRFWPLRVSAAAEQAGLNVAEHGANTDLHELLQTMSEQAASMDLSKRANQDPYNDVGQIGLHYNNLLYHLERSTAQTEKLLSDVLPAEVARRLRKGERVADTYDEVTVLFADIVGFTRLTQNLLARRLIETLNDIFARFDVLATQHRLEKIKTIGDNYMAVAGILDGRGTDHAAAAAEMALAMHDTVRQYCLEEYGDVNNQNISLRIGMHSGPVVAGVLGTRRFVYDLWGDTVNTASRMESHGMPNETQVTETTYDLLKKKYVFELRGNVDIKGKGPMRTYLLKGKFPDLAAGTVSQYGTGPAPGGPMPLTS